MPFARTRPQLLLSVEDRSALVALSQARTEAAQRVERARILLAYLRLSTTYHPTNSGRLRLPAGT